MKKKNKFVEEFKTFIMRGNVFDMAIGVIVGGAFGKITTSLVNDLLMPFIGWICGTRDMSVLNLVVRPEISADGEIVQEAIVLGFGSFLSTILDFLLIALVVFLLVKAINKAHEKRSSEEAAEEPAPEEPKPGAEELLSQILEEIKKK